ncbi:hypothetical protein AQI88_38950 [Streptomyces cellostaticus]|uniref:Uncharacterized protein n=1 Tax=Streptomyces cellostaticus TaxID=67285 RepID=A0A101NBM2_9ACTN|nr:hypothetical protein [Streptomyces cellostaticus]KUM90136.1 hypothetical protein AQI88_38950 [Streptomyces cellostaticus]GHI10310.1 hypothetical protein Scel_86310 [Streptomyces cellostaticus]
MRHFTDAFTNQAVLSPEQVCQWLPELVRADGKPPADFMPAFLHEATHHWCFSSPVYTLVTLLGMRSRVEAFLALEASTPAQRAHWEARSVEDLLRAETVTDVYRPLAEGLAAFAEFDLLPAPWNRLLPAPLRWAVKFYGARTVVDVAQVRLGDEVRRRKESLLAQPLSCQDSDGYLAGYLTVKMLQNRWSLDHPEPGLWTSDQFLEIAYHRFYEDEDLIALLLDPGQRAPASMNTLVAYLAQRIQGSFMGIAARLADEQRARMGAVRTAGPIRYTAPVVSEDVGPGFAGLWQMVFADLPIDMSSAGLESGQLARHFSLILHSRDLMLIGELPCTVDIRDGRAHVFANGREVASLAMGKSPEGRCTPAILYLYLMTRGGQRVVAVAATEPDFSLFCSSDPPWSTGPVWSSNPEIAGNSEFALEGLVLGRLSHSLAQELISSRAAAFGQFPGLRRVGGYRRQTRGFLDPIYRLCGALDVPEDQLEPVWALMRDEGFYGLFDHDADLVQALATAGLVSSAGLVGNLEWVFERMGMTGDAAVASLRRFADRFGMFRIADGRDEPPGRLFCSV